MKRPTFYVVLPKFFWLALLLAIFIAAVSSQAVADPITSITHLNKFPRHASANDVGIAQGDRNQFGADPVPRVGTTITGVQGGFTVGPSPLRRVNCRTEFLRRYGTIQPNSHWNVEASRFRTERTRPLLQLPRWPVFLPLRFPFLSA